MKPVSVLLSVCAAAVLAVTVGGSPAMAAGGRHGDMPEADKQLLRGPGAVKIINRQSGDCLDQSFVGGSEHQEVIAFPCERTAFNQYWHTNLQPDGTYMITTDFTKKCLDQNYANGVHHYDVLAYTCKNTRNQRWFINWDPNKAGYLILNEESGDCLDQNYANGQRHQEVLVWPCNFDPNRPFSNQVWRIEAA